ncbi:GmrSD restriction endonuclease domain-containing protein [Nocardia niigatensis]|uniref:GmrSD restriction endonuclease domain-containing protein n=1 Tax=Nocardia niigatensis TaxID=209249 RepID=UPI000593FBCE|nr:DUF262 domain-containing protein [Nocardia niigatensis]
MALDNPRLKDVLVQVGTGAIQLPDFQRDWKWDDQRIRELVATVTLDYPLGVVMTLETGGKSWFRAKPLTGVTSASQTEPSLLLLDGQQRLTSLFQALQADNPVLTYDSRGDEFRCWYYIDMEKAVNAPADRDDAIISVPEPKANEIKVIRGRFPHRFDIDLSDIEAECRAKHFPLNIVFETQRVHEWQQRFVELDRDNWPLWSDFERKVLENIRGFLVPMIKLPAATTRDAVCSVFERVNTGGVALNVFELLTATYAGDRDYEREHGTYYHLPAEWRRIKKDLADLYPVFGLPDFADDGLTSTDFLQAVTLAYTWERKQQRLAASVSCKRPDLLTLPLQDFIRLAPDLQEAFAWVGEFLTRQGIGRARDLPYRTQILPLAAARTILGKKADDPAVIDRITRWYWCGVLGEMYSGSTESRLTRDLEQLVEWAEPGGSQPDTVTEAVFVSERLDSLTTRNSAAYKGIYALLVKQGIIDWYYTQAPLRPDDFDQYAVDIQQIFPKTWCERNRIDKKMASSIVNKTLLSQRASRSVVSAPNSYLPVLASETGTRAEWFDDIVATHFVDPRFLHSADFHAFYADRSRQLLDLVVSAMGKGTVFRGPAE